MSRAERKTAWLLAAALGASLACAAAPAVAQTNLVGYWNPIFHEDVDERIPGPSIGDYLGLPITHAVAVLGQVAVYHGDQAIFVIHDQNRFCHEIHSLYQYIKGRLAELPASSLA